MNQYYMRRQPYPQPVHKRTDKSKILFIIIAMVLILSVAILLMWLLGVFESDGISRKSKDIEYAAKYVRVLQDDLKDPLSLRIMSDIYITEYFLPDDSSLENYNGEDIDMTIAEFEYNAKNSYGGYGTAEIVSVTRMKEDGGDIYYHFSANEFNESFPYDDSKKVNNDDKYLIVDGEKVAEYLGVSYYK